MNKHPIFNKTTILWSMPGIIFSLLFLQFAPKPYTVITSKEVCINDECKNHLAYTESGGSLYFMPDASIILCTNARNKEAMEICNRTELKF